MIVLDASVLIAYLDVDDRHHASAEGLLAREVDDDFAASQITLAEVLVVPVRDDRLQAARSILRDLGVEERPLPNDAAVQLARLRTTTRLKLPDCCVLLTAETEEARLASFDARLVTAAQDRRLPVLRS